MSALIQSPDQIKQTVKEKYTAISNQSAESCCGPSGCCSPESPVDYSIFSDDYSKLDGYSPDADLKLGCGLPTEYAKMKGGDTVVDLGSGAGNDAFIARQIVGESGKVIGIDMTEAMIQRATLNAIKLKYDNVDFVLGDIEEIPLANNIADVVVSNCVLNLVPDKEKAFAEIYRILKPGGHFSISDVVISGELPNQIKEDAEMYAGCVAGAIDENDYLKIVQKTEFENITVQKLKEIQLPDEMLLNYLSEEGLEQFRNSKVGIYSMTLYAEKG
jgi:ubiquinone/menaquinone biosynthesis C-methylase UbiE